MLDALSGLTAMVLEHPLLTVLIFLIIAAACTIVLAGEHAGESVNGMLRVLWSIVTTPFLFLRRVLRMMREPDALEAPYAGTRGQLPYRALRIQYVFIFLTALLLLAGGIAASLFAFYPKAEIAAHKAAAEQLESLEEQVAEQQKLIERSGKPEFKAELTARLEEAKAKAKKAAAAVRQILQSPPYYSDAYGLGSNLIAGQPNADDLQEMISQWDENCLSEESPGFDWAAFCEDYKNNKKHYDAIRDLKLDQFDSATKLAEAQDALRNWDSSADTARARLEELEPQREEIKARYDSTSLVRLGWLPGHFKASLWLLLTTLTVVIGYVWAGAVIADVVSWIILIMLGLERHFVRTSPELAWPAGMTSGREEPSPGD